VASVVATVRRPFLTDSEDWRMSYERDRLFRPFLSLVLAFQFVTR